MTTTASNRIEMALTGARRRVDGLEPRSFLLVALLPVLLVYLATASWTTAKSPDPITNAVTGWTLANEGTVYLDDYAAWSGVRTGPILVVEGDGRPVAQFPPGAALLAVPLYVVWPGEPEVWPPGDSRRLDDVDLDIAVPPLGPAALLGALTTALAVAVAALTARPLIGASNALVGGWILGFGSGAWAVAADTLWQHGPDMLWLTLGVWLASSNREWLAGVAFGMAVLTRPPTAIVAATVGIALAWKGRSFGPLWRIGIGSTAGLLAVVTYNAAVFGGGSVSGGYGTGATSNARSADILAYLDNIRSGLIDPTRGLLSLSPWVALVSAGAVAVRKQLPPAVAGGAIGGLLYLLVQWKANLFGGGANFVGYRYPLEAIAAAAPALMAGWLWIERNRPAKVALLVTAAYSLALYTAFTL